MLAPAVPSLLAILAGCSGVDRVQEEEIRELRYQNERRHESLVRDEARIAALEDRLGALVEERDSLTKQVDSLQTNLRYSRENANSLARDRDEAKRRSEEAERTAERAIQNLEKVKSVAGASANELAELRLQHEQHAEQIQVLAKQESALRDENATIAKALETAKEELVRNLAVVRSLRGEENAASEGLRAALDEAERLREENDELKAELSELESRSSAAAVASDRAAPAAVRAVPPAPVARAERRDRLDVAVQSLVAEVQGRFRKATRGEFVFDALGKTLAGAVVLVVLCAIWAGVRWVRAWRLSKHVRALAARVLELEQMQVEAVASGGAEGSPRSRTDDAGNLRQRRSSTRRRSGFSAVISPKAVEGTEPTAGAQGSSSEGAEAAPSVPEDSSFPEPVAVSASAREARDPAASRGAGAARKVIGAGVWDDLSTPRPASPGLVESETAPGGEATELLALPSTQIIAGTRGDLAAREPRDAGRGPGASKPAPSSSEPEDDLLEELRSVVHRKYDELAK